MIRASLELLIQLLFLIRAARYGTGPPIPVKLAHLAGSSLMEAALRSLISANPQMPVTDTAFPAI